MRRFAVIAFVVAVIAPATAVAFTSTPGAGKVIREMDAAYKRVRSVRAVLTGAVVYCPGGIEPWTFAPAPGCPTRAVVTEGDKLLDGRSVLAVGTVRARSKPTLHYQISAEGYFQRAGNARCWSVVHGPFFPPQWIEYPFPHEHVKIESRTATQIVLQAVSPSYRELDYVDARTHLEPRQVEFLTVRHKTHRVDILNEVLHTTVRAAPTPPCVTRLRAH